MRARLSTLSRQTAGFALVEVMISAALVLIVGAGVLKGVDGAQRTSRENRARSVAADLAQQDQERLRSFKATDLSNYFNVRTVKPGGDPSVGGPFSVESKSQWVTDKSGSVSCVNSSSQANYLLITSKVTWPDMAPLKPVVASSLVAPPNGSFGPDQGSAAIQVLGRDGDGVSDALVTISGPTTGSATTNDMGCVVFGYIAPGSYDVTVSKPGYVDQAGNASPATSIGVVGGATTLYSFSYDQAAGITVSFDTVAADGSVQPAQAPSASLANPDLLSGPRVFPPTSAGLASSIDATGLYPSSGGYTVFAGRCTDSNPNLHQPGYFNTAGNSGFVATAPGGGYAVTVRVPSIDVTVIDSTGNPVPGAGVRVTPTAAGCGDSWAASADATGRLRLPLPFGAYAVCADDGASATAHSAATPTDSPLVNDTPTGPSSGPLTLQLPASSNGSCA